MPSPTREATGCQSSFDAASLIIALLIGVYLIWILRKTTPEKKMPAANGSNRSMAKYAAGAVIVVGIVVAMTWSTQDSVPNSKKDWEPRGEVLAGLRAGMSRDEVHRVKGQPYALQNEPNRDWDTWHFCEMGSFV
jgi:hypothetical protein